MVADPQEPAGPGRGDYQGDPKVIRPTLVAERCAVAASDSIHSSFRLDRKQ